MKVAYLVNQYPKPSHSFIRREVLALERLGVEVQRFAVRGWDAEFPDAGDAAERLKTRYLLQGGLVPLAAATLRAAVAAPGRWLRGLKAALRLSRRAERPLLYHLIYFGQACLLLEWLRRGAVSHLHAHFGTNSAEVALLARELGGPPFSITVHGPEEFDKPAALHLADKANAAAFLVAVSSYGRSQLYRWIPHESWARVEVVHCGVDPGFHRGEASSPPDVARLVCVGRLCEQKGQLLLVEAMSRLFARGHVFELVLAGDGEMRAAIEARVAAHGLGGHVRITGWIDSEAVREEILAARALVLPSFAEGLPVVIMEAMTLARPVVSTYIAGIPELVVDGQTGWLVPAGDLTALCNALERCLGASPGQLARMGDAGRARALERHDVDREAGKLAALFARTPVGGDATSPAGR